MLAGERVRRHGGATTKTTRPIGRSEGCVSIDGMNARPLLLALSCSAGALFAQANDAHSSKAPPKGAPWVTDFAAARAAAMAANKPIFVYSTKTY